MKRDRPPLRARGGPHGINLPIPCGLSWRVLLRANADVILPRPKDDERQQLARRPAAPGVRCRHRADAAQVLPHFVAASKTRTWASPRWPMVATVHSTLSALELDRIRNSPFRVSPAVGRERFGGECRACHGGARRECQAISAFSPSTKMVGRDGPVFNRVRNVRTHNRVSRSRKGLLQCPQV